MQCGRNGAWVTISGLIFAAVVSVLIPLGTAQAVSCSGDTWADVGDGSALSVIHWQDNYVVGGTCDLNGEYTVGIQRINWGQGFRSSGVDGFFGSNTQDDVEAFQSQEGETVDGVVGTNTWDAYETKLIHDGTSGSWEYFKAEGYSRSWFRHTGLSPDRWYGRKLNTSSTWVAFGTSGPS